MINVQSRRRKLDPINDEQTSQMSKKEDRLLFE